MVAYSFKSRFVDIIQSGHKRQTVRAERKRHARPGEQLQLYTAMRTRHCRLLGRSQCVAIRNIRFDFDARRIELECPFELIFTPTGLDVFAWRDGFENWEKLEAFWRAEHNAISRFTGVLIQWGDLRQEGA